MQSQAHSPFSVMTKCVVCSISSGFSNTIDGMSLRCETIKQGESQAGALEIEGSCGDQASPRSALKVLLCNPHAYQLDSRF